MLSFVIHAFKGFKTPLFLCLSIFFSSIKYNILSFIKVYNITYNNTPAYDNLFRDAYMVHLFKTVFLFQNFETTTSCNIVFIIAFIIVSH